MSGMDAYLKNAGLLGGGGAAPAGLGSQAQGQRGQYFAGQTRAFLERQAPYASNLFEARVQGLDPADPEGECWKEVRVADMLSENSSTSYILDGWKFVYFRDPEVERVPQGAKLWFGGSCYLVCNPLSVSSVVGSAVVRQCSAVWNRLDEYGNVLAEPFVLGRMPTKGNANRAEELGIYAEHYLDCIMSRRGAGRLLRENVRLVLGQAAYAVRGVNDFSREFTGEADSVGLVYFTLYRQDPTELDDLERGVAGGRGFTWEVQVSSPPVVRVGELAAVGAASLRCGAPFLGEASYRWVSSDPSVCAVEEGAVLGVASGTCGITCTLEQNPAWSRTVEVRVEAAGAGGPLRLAGAGAAAAVHRGGAGGGVLRRGDGDRGGGGVPAVRAAGGVLCGQPGGEPAGGAVPVSVGGGVKDRSAEACGAGGPSQSGRAGQLPRRGSQGRGTENEGDATYCGSGDSVKGVLKWHSVVPMRTGSGGSRR